jgi:hypothetical protein
MRDRNAFDQAVIVLPGEDTKPRNYCVYQAPPGFALKPALAEIYGDELKELFHGILSIPDVSSSEALQHLQQLKSDASSTMSSVLGTYKYLQENYRYL